MSWIKRTPAAMTYIRRAVHLRQKLTNRAMAQRFCVTENTMSEWVSLALLRPLARKQRQLR